MKKLVALLTEEKRKTTINEWGIVTLAFFELYAAYIKNWDDSFFHITR